MFSKTIDATHFLDVSTIKKINFNQSLKKTIQFNIERI